MDKKTMTMTFASSLSDICSKNASFDSGILKVCYPGRNRNGSYIEKEDLVRCIPTMYNCPVVCNYDRDSDSIGGHDVEVVRDDGGIRLVNLTVPVGVIPESAKYWFEECEEEDGTKHEYLFVETLIWKRQEAYDKIKRDGITAHSMEIQVKDGGKVDGVYHIRDFEFTAFTLIGVEPCFEGSSLTMNTFSAGEKETFKRELSEMMQDLKETYTLVNTPGDESGADNTPTHNITTEGGDRILEEKMKLLGEFGKKPEDLDFSIDELSLDELRERLAKFNADDEPDNEPENDPESGAEDPAEGQVEAGAEDADPAGQEEAPEEEGGEDETPAAEDDGDDDVPGRIGNPVSVYELAGNIREWLRDAVNAIGTFTDTYGYTYPLYWMIDYDADNGMVYCECDKDWKIYGFSYTMSGDKPVIDTESKKRMKHAFVAFEGDDTDEPVPAFYSAMTENLAGKIAECEAAAGKISEMETELGGLRAYKAEKESAEADKARAEVYARFSDLAGTDAFEALKNDADRYSIEELEEKCYALRGRTMTAAKFSYQQMTTPRLIVDKTTDKAAENDSLPYGGLVERYGGNAR